MLLTCLLAVVACRQHARQTQIRALMAGLDNSNKFIAGETDKLDNLLQGRYQDPSTHEKTGIWIPRIGTLKKLSENINAYIHSLEAALEKEAGISGDTTGRLGEEDVTVGDRFFERAGKKKELHDRLVAYRQAILDDWRPDSLSAISPIREHIKESIAKITTGIPVADTKTFDTENMTAFMGLAYLDKIRNDLLLVENRLFHFAITYTTSSIFQYDLFSVIIAPNKTYLKKGQPLTIVAGVGSFSLQAEPEVTINGRKIPMNAEGLAEYKITVNGNPGKHHIPVKVRFVKPTGERSTIYRTLEYEIAP